MKLFVILVLCRISTFLNFWLRWNNVVSFLLSMFNISPNVVGNVSSLSERRWKKFISITCGYICRFLNRKFLTTSNSKMISNCKTKLAQQRDHQYKTKHEQNSITWYCETGIFSLVLQSQFIRWFLKWSKPLKNSRRWTEKKFWKERFTMILNFLTVRKS